MTIDTEELEQITEQVWELIMQTAIARVAPADLPTDVASIVASVRLTGAYRGTVALQVADDLLRRAAATMFGVDADAGTESEMSDTVRELANMVAGNIKCLVAQPTELGFPTATPADQFHANRSAGALRIAFEHDGAPLHVTVYE